MDGNKAVGYDSCTTFLQLLKHKMCDFMLRYTKCL